MKFSFEPPFTYIVVGNSGSGKTTLINYLLKSTFIPMFKKNIFIMSPTMKYSGDFKDYRDKVEDPKKRKHDDGQHFYDEWEPDVIQEIIQTQQENILEHGKDKTPHVLLIVDDLLEVLHTSSIIDKLFFKARHFKISTILLFQKMKGLSRVCRINCKYLTFFRTANESELEDIMDEFFSKTQKKRLQPLVLEWFQQPWSFIHMDLKTQNFEDRLHFGKDKKLIEKVSS